jgi:hypothetical protein
VFKGLTFSRPQFPTLHIAVRTSCNRQTRGNLFATMDTVLETFDTYCLDWFYAVALPPKESTVIGLQSYPSSYGSGSALLLHNRVPTRTYTDDGWIQEQSLKCSPTGLDQNVYYSRLGRDNIIRQALSLFTITWSVDIIGQAQQRVLDNQINVPIQAIGYTPLFGIRIPATSLFSTRPIYSTPNSSKIRYLLRSNKLWLLSQLWLS